MADLGALGMLASEFLMPYKGVEFLSALEHPLLQDMAIHLFDAARAISGADPVSVYCESFRPPWTWGTSRRLLGDGDLRDDGGLRYTFTGSWSAHGLPTSWTGSWRAAGTRGTALWVGEDAITVGAAPSDVQTRRARAGPVPGAPPLHRAGRGAGGVRHRPAHRAACRRASATTTSAAWPW